MQDRTMRTSHSPAERPRRASHAIAALLGLLLGSACGESPAPPPVTEPPALDPAAKPSGAPSAAAGTAAPASQKPVVTLEQLLDVHRSYGPRALGEDRFVYLSDAPGTAQIFASPEKGAGDAKGAVPRQLTSFQDRVSGLRVVPGGARLLFLKDSGGDENDQIFVLDLAAGGEAVGLTEAPKVKHTLPSTDSAGGRIAYTSNARNGKDMDLYIDALPAAAAKPGGDAKAPAKGSDAKAPARGGDAKDGAKKAPFVELNGSYAVDDWSGDKILLTEARSSFDQDIWVVDAKTKKKTLLSKHTGDERYERAHFSRDGRTVFVLTDAGRERLALVAIDIATSKRTPIVEDKYDVEKLSMPSHGSTESGAAKGAASAGLSTEDVLFFVINKDGVEEVYSAVVGKDRKDIKRTPVGLTGVVGSIDVSPRGDVAYVAMERSNLPVEVFRVQKGGGSERVTYSHHAGIDESKLVKEELLSAPSFDRQPISFFWYSAPAESGKKRPVIIMIHGGPEGQAQPVFNPVLQYFALNGYAVAAPNVRGSTGYDKSFAHLDDKEKREDSVKDLSEVGKFIAARPDVDPSRIALYGGSYGGYMVLAGLTLYPEQWAAGIDIVGIANFRTFLKQTADYRRALREAEYGSLEKDGEFLDRISPISRVEKIRAPLMVIHGVRDPRVPIGEARQIAEAVKKRGVPVELMTFDDEGHGLAKRKNRLVAYPAVVKFLDTHMKGKP